MGKDVKKMKSSNAAGVKLKWCSYFGKSLAVPPKVKYRIIIWPSNSTPRTVKCGHTNVHNNIIPNSQKVEKENIC